MSNSVKKSAVNTVFMYGKMVVSTITTFIGTRIVLEQLGAENFGLYNLIAGITAMLGFFRSSLSISNQRYISLAIGAKNNNRLQEVFNSSRVLHLLLAIILILLFEIIGSYLINTKLEIPKHSIKIAFIIFQFLIANVAFSITSIPYVSLISSNEDIHVIAILYTLDAIGKFITALLLIIVESNQLIFYAAGLTVTFTLSRLAIQFYCKHKYKNLNYGFTLKGDRNLMKEIFSFTGYSSIGAISELIRTQGIGVIFNLFFGLIINAAYALVLQINGQLRFFANSLMMTLNPQIIKAEGSGNRDKMLELAMKSTKYSFFILCIVSIPVYWQLPFLLDLWLKDVPQYTLDLSRLMIVQAIVFQLGSGINTAINSIGDIKNYQIISSLVYLAVLPFAYILLKIGYSPNVVLYNSIAIEIIVLYFRVFYLNKLTNFPKGRYFYDIFRYAVIPVCIGIIILFFVDGLISDFSKLVYFIIAIILSMLISCVSIFIFGLDRNEKRFFLDKILSLYGRFMS